MEVKNEKNMQNLVEFVEPESIAAEVGIEPGDRLISVNDVWVNDIIEYRFMIAGEEIAVKIEKKNGEIWEIEIEKEYDEDLGILFYNQLLGCAHTCRNKCMFCYVDQLPKGMRKSLYLKDDDSRLSFLQGNFVTLTNVAEEEIERIIRYRISPINVSVHATDPDLRVKMLKNPAAGNLLPLMKRFADAGIQMSCQIVLVPGVNDKENLDRTLTDLSALYPAVHSVAIVPLGLTRHREGLAPLKGFTGDQAREFLNQLAGHQARFQEKFGTSFAFAGDEFYFLAGRALPEAIHYEDFDMIEDGVGMVSKFVSEFETALQAYVPEKDKESRAYLIVTGTLMEAIMRQLAARLMERKPWLSIEVVGVQNHFFGTTITVSGLLTGQDVIDQTENMLEGKTLVLPENILKSGEAVFLDDYRLEDLKAKLNTDIIIMENDGRRFFTDL